MFVLALPDRRSYHEMSLHATLSLEFLSQNFTRTAHCSMAYQTFITSSSVISPPIFLSASIGYEHVEAGTIENVGSVLVHGLVLVPPYYGTRQIFPR